MQKQEMQKKMRNLVQLHKRGHLSAEQVVRLAKQYKLEASR